ncbi:MAG: hypothetical protein ACFFEW_18035 [Candidatus Thorarchaeota archaeon]
MAAPTNSQIQQKYNTLLRNIGKSKLKPLDQAKEGARWYGKLLFLKDLADKNKKKIRLNWQPKEFGKQKARLKAKWYENAGEVGMSNPMADIQRLCHAFMGYNQILKNYKSTYSGVVWPDANNTQECKKQVEAWESDKRQQTNQLRDFVELPPLR